MWAFFTYINKTNCSIVNMCSNFPSSYLSNNMFLLQVLTPTLKRKLFKQTQIFVVSSSAVNLCPIAHTTLTNTAAVLRVAASHPILGTIQYKWVYHYLVFFLCKMYVFFTKQGLICWLLALIIYIHNNKLNARQFTNLI